jgi:hypothetical protein
VTKLVYAANALAAASPEDHEAKAEEFQRANEEWVRIEKLLVAEILAVAERVDDENRERLCNALVRFVQARE